MDATTLTARAVDLDADNPGYESLDVIGVLAGTSGESVDVAVAASDAVGPVTNTRSTVVPTATSQRLGRLDGTAVGDTGAAGRVVVVLTLSIGGCQLGSFTLAVDGVDPATFAGWHTSPARLQAVLDAYTVADQVDAAIATPHA